MKAKHWIGVLVVVVGLVGLTSCRSKKTEEKPTVKFGTAMPLTGPQAEMGKDLLNGITLAVEQVNNAGGILGHKIKLIAEDDQADPKTAVAVANKFAATNDLFVVVGHMNSGTTLPATSVYSRAGIPVIMPVPTNPEITKQGYNNLFRIPPTDDMQGPILANYGKTKLSIKSFAIIDDKSAYGTGIAKAFEQSLEPDDIKYKDSINRGAKDFRSLLSKINNAGIEGVLYAGDYPEAIIILRQAKELAMKVQFFMGDGCYTESLIKKAGSSAEDAIISFIAPPWESSKNAQRFLQDYKNEYGRSPMSFAPLGYDAVMVAVEGIKKAGNIDQRSLKTVLLEKSFSYSGVTSTIVFTDIGDNAGAQVYIYEVKDGGFKFVE